MLMKPSTIYWISILDVLKGLSVAILCVAISVLVFTFLTRAEMLEDEKQHCNMIIKISCIVLVISILSIIFIPSKEVMYEMLISKFITVDNINMTIEELKELVDYITTKIAEIN